MIEEGGAKKSPADNKIKLIKSVITFHTFYVSPL